MSEVRSDNRQERHPKPTQDFERRFTDPGFVDWADVAELEAAYPLEYRKNKYFWINNQYFECEDDGVTYRLIGGGGGSGNASITSYLPLVATNTITVPALSGHVFWACIMARQPFTNADVPQTGTTLDFTNVGGTIANELIVIFYV